MSAAATAAANTIKHINNLVLGPSSDPASLWLPLIILGVSFLLLSLYYTRTYSESRELLAKGFAGPKPLPIIGNAFALVVPTHGKFNTLLSKPK